MLKEKIKTVFKAVGGTNRSVAAYAEMAAANIGKLTNGSRIPSIKSSTARKLVNGIYAFSEANNKLTELCETVGCGSSESEESIRSALLAFLYENVPQTEDNAVQFAERLQSVMGICGVNCTELSREAGVDSALIDNLYNGVRVPSRRAKLLNTICEILADLAVKHGRMGEIAELVGFSEYDLSEVNAGLMILDWLKGRTPAADTVAAAQFINRMTDIPSPTLRLPVFESVATKEILSENRTSYVGIGGLQRAVTRFLGNAANNPGCELLLYSDQSMEWMQTSFTPRWLSLMRACLENGVRMKIIHNIDRDPSEMLFALQSWIPLYMSGLIEPYYRFDKCGNRFRHTVFISDTDCIDGFCTIGTERECVYRYSTGADEIRHIRNSFSKLGVSVKPLIKHETGEFIPLKKFREYDHGDIRMYIAQNEAVIAKLSEPRYYFSFKHPYMIRMFSIYAQTSGRYSRPGSDDQLLSDTKENLT
ncbi:MAG: hypothetical protein IK093_16015 [Ruminiclostridium sp.]|nr:hypothetical protein [Ruminiclostridium sp.]